MEPAFRMHAERTPNPHSIKWVLGRSVASGVASAHFDKAPSPSVSTLAAALFALPGVTGVFLGPDFVTISKREDLEWTDLAEPIVAALKAWAASEQPALGPDYAPPEAREGGEIVARIVEILERDIRPYVAMDGGEISFKSYRDGVVEVALRGSCNGCPSAVNTLKQGIERRLQQDIPEVREVVAV